MNIELRHYKTDKIENNWDVYYYGTHIGYVHDCEGIGGSIGKYTDTELFDAVCHLAKHHLNKLKGL